MKRYIYIISLLITTVICSCQFNKQENYIEKEKVEIQKEIEDILLKLGYVDFTLHIYYHKTYNNREISKSASILRVSGDEIPINTMNHIDDFYFPSDENDEYIKNGNIESRNTTINYDEKYSRTINYEYLSVLIIITGIEQNEVNELVKLFSNYILNINRGDTIFIKSK
jgi:hypothetical protein